MRDIHSLEPLWNEWHVKRRLGYGAYGTVYEIEKKSLGRSYYAAVKHIPIPPEWDDFESEEDLDLSLKERSRELLEGLCSEIEINSQLKGYTNIVSYEDHQVIDRPNGTGYDVLIKMELLTSLTKYIKQTPMTVGDIVRLGQEICVALTVLQQKNIVHRDIKPANIFINDSGDFKLGDFSVSKIMERAQEGMTTRGTPTYMAPEVDRSEEGDYRLDLYSLGLVLYRLLNRNRPPFASQGENRLSQEEVVECNRRRLRGEALPPPVLADRMLGEIIIRACAFRPEDRWKDAKELHWQLKHYEDQAGAQILGQVVLEARSTNPEPTGTGSITELSDTPPKAAPPLEANPLPDEDDGTVLIRKPNRPPVDEPPPERSSKPVKPPEPSKNKRPLLLAGLGGGAVILTAAMLAAFSGGGSVPAASSAPPALPVLSVPCAADVSSRFFSVFPPQFFPDEAPEWKQMARWTDPGVEAAVRQAIGVPEGAIPVEDLEQITQLHVTQTTDSLEDLRYLTGLTSLNLSGLSCTDGLLPDGLTGLRELNIADNQFTSLAFVQGMPHLRALNISGNPISDLSPLADAKELETVTAENIPAEDWSALEHVSSVTGRPEPEEEPEPEQPVSNPNSTQKPSSQQTNKPSSKPGKPSTPAQPDPPSVSGISISSSSLVMQTGGKHSLSASLSPAGASGSISWSSSNSGVARVSGGTVTAVGPGSATITASCNGHSVSCTVSVSN